MSKSYNQTVDTNSNISKIKKLLTKHGATTIPVAREILSKRIQDEDLLDEVIVRLVDDDFLVLTGAGDNNNSSSSNPYILSYKRAMAFLFRNSNKQSFTRSEMKNEMSFKLDWFTPSDAAAFVEFCLRDGLIVEDPSTGAITPAFDPAGVDIPFGWSLNEELQIKTGKDMAREVIDHKREKSEIKFVMGEYQDDLERQLAEDGMFDDDELDASVHVDVPFDGVERMTVSEWYDERKAVAKDLSERLGIPVKNAYNMHDYYELNRGVIDKDMFVLTMHSFEKITDSDLLDRAYELLIKSNIKTGENL